MSKFHNIINNNQESNYDLDNPDELEQKLEKDNNNLKNHIKMLQDTIKNLKKDSSSVYNNNNTVNTVNAVSLKTNFPSSVNSSIKRDFNIDSNNNNLGIYGNKESNEVNINMKNKSYKNNTDDYLTKLNNILEKEDQKENKDRELEKKEYKEYTTNYNYNNDNNIENHNANHNNNDKYSSNLKFSFQGEAELNKQSKINDNNEFKIDDFKQKYSYNDIEKPSYKNFIINSCSNNSHLYNNNNVPIASKYLNNDNCTPETDIKRAKESFYDYKLFNKNNDPGLSNFNFNKGNSELISCNEFKNNNSKYTNNESSIKEPKEFKERFTTPIINKEKNNYNFNTNAKTNIDYNYNYGFESKITNNSINSGITGNRNSYLNPNLYNISNKNVLSNNDSNSNIDNFGHYSNLENYYCNTTSNVPIIPNIPASNRKSKNEHFIENNERNMSLSNKIDINATHTNTNTKSNEVNDVNDKNIDKDNLYSDSVYNTHSNNDDYSNQFRRNTPELIATNYNNCNTEVDRDNKVTRNINNSNYTNNNNNKNSFSNNTNNNLNYNKARITDDMFSFNNVDNSRKDRYNRKTDDVNNNNKDDDNDEDNESEDSFENKIKSNIQYNNDNENNKDAYNKRNLIELNELNDDFKEINDNLNDISKGRLLQMKIIKNSSNINVINNHQSLRETNENRENQNKSKKSTCISNPIDTNIDEQQNNKDINYNEYNDFNDYNENQLVSDMSRISNVSKNIKRNNKSNKTDHRSNNKNNIAKTPMRTNNNAINTYITTPMNNKSSKSLGKVSKTIQTNKIKQVKSNLNDKKPSVLVNKNIKINNRENNTTTKHKHNALSNKNSKIKSDNYIEKYNNKENSHIEVSSTCIECEQLVLLNKQLLEKIKLLEKENKEVKEELRTEKTKTEKYDLFAQEMISFYENNNSNNSQNSYNSHNLNSNYVNTNTQNSNNNRSKNTMYNKSDRNRIWK